MDNNLCILYLLLRIWILHIQATIWEDFLIKRWLTFAVMGFEPTPSMSPHLPSQAGQNSIHLSSLRPVRVTTATVRPPVWPNLPFSRILSLKSSTNSRFQIAWITGPTTDSNFRHENFQGYPQSQQNYYQQMPVVLSFKPLRIIYCLF